MCGPACPVAGRARGGFGRTGCQEKDIRLRGAHARSRMPGHENRVVPFSGKRATASRNIPFKKRPLEGLRLDHGRYVLPSQSILAWIPTAIIGLRIRAAGQGAEVLVDYFIPWRGINRTGIAVACFRATECGCRWCQSRLRPEGGCGRVSEIVPPWFVCQARSSRGRR